jgi:hypothetical protein
VLTVAGMFAMPSSSNDQPRSELFLVIQLWRNRALMLGQFQSGDDPGLIHRHSRQPYVYFAPHV